VGAALWTVMVRVPRRDVPRALAKIRFEVVTGKTYAAGSIPHADRHLRRVGLPAGCDALGCRPADLFTVRPILAD
jgi:hypothetical protein